jgi:hypothetical protein
MISQGSVEYQLTGLIEVLAPFSSPVLPATIRRDLPLTAPI